MGCIAGTQSQSYWAHYPGTNPYGLGKVTACTSSDAGKKQPWLPMSPKHPSIKSWSLRSRRSPRLQSPQADTSSLLVLSQAVTKIFQAIKHSEVERGWGLAPQLCCLQECMPLNMTKQTMHVDPCILSSLVLRVSWHCEYKACMHTAFYYVILIHTKWVQKN